jgi:hypothetical protein
MKDEFISLSPVGAIALFIGGVLIGASITGHFDIAPALFGALALAVARENAREGFATGSYVRGWFMWKRVGPSVETKTEGNIVPFKGPAA